MATDKKAEEKKDTKVDLGEIGQIELPKLDVSKYIGTKVKIATAETHEGAYGYFVKIETDPVDTIERKDQDDIVLTPSTIFSLQQDADGKIGWGEDTKLGKYLKKMGVAHFKELVGKEVIVQVRQSKDGEQEFLTFA